MKDVLIKTYKFDELDATNQKKMLEKYADININNFELIAEDTISDISGKYKSKGFNFDAENVMYDIYSGQGSGVSFVGNLDLSKFIDAFLDDNYPNKRDFERIAKLEAFQFEFKRISSHYCHSYTVETELIVYASYFWQRQYKNINNTIDNLIKTIENIRVDICKEIERELENLYDYLASEDSIKETLIANDYDFSINLNCYGIFND